MEQQRQLGLAATIAVVTGESIALGIFLTPAAMAKSLGSPLLLIAVWCGMGLMGVDLRPRNRGKPDAPDTAPQRIRIHPCCHCWRNRQCLLQLWRMVGCRQGCRRGTESAPYPSPGLHSGCADCDHCLP